MISLESRLLTCFRNTAFCFSLTVYRNPRAILSKSFLFKKTSTFKTNFRSKNSSFPFQRIVDWIRKKKNYAFASSQEVPPDSRRVNNNKKNAQTLKSRKMKLFTRKEKKKEWEVQLYNWISHSWWKELGMAPSFEYGMLHPFSREHTTEIGHGNIPAYKTGRCHKYIGNMPFGLREGSSQ